MSASNPSGDAKNLAQLEAILENAVDAIITIDEVGIVQSANPATKRLFGYSIDAITGRNIKMLMPSPYHEEHDGYLENYRRTGDRQIIGIGREVTGRRKDGSTFPMHLAVSEVTIGDRRMFTGIVRDISDLTAAQAELTQLNDSLEERVREHTRELRAAQAELVTKEKLATLGQVSGGIAHEIRNPLNAVKSSVYYLLNASNPSTEKQREHLQRIDRQVTQIDNVVTTLSDVARLPDAHVSPVNIETHLRSVAGSVSLPSSIEIIWQLPEDLPEAMVDENQIPIVFRNLLRNARDAMPDGGEITISGQGREGRVTIGIADTGTGIPPDLIARITEPLYSTKARGMGLGLAISRAIVDKNAGELIIDSIPNKGSIFSVVLQSAEKSAEGITQ